MTESHAAAAPKSSALEVFWVFLRLGLISFGGPVAHLGYFRTEFVERRRWIDSHGYADLVALCQFLPGPASSQVGLAVGLLRGGLAGAGAAWLGFTLPSAILMILFAYGVTHVGDALGSGWLHGLKLVAVAVVAHAVWGMAQTLCPDRLRATFAVLAAMILLSVETAFAQIGVIALGALAGWLLISPEETAEEAPLPVSVSRRLGAILLAVFFAVLAGLPIAAHLLDSHSLDLIDAFYRAGALVFGGGHVVLPLLQAEVVAPGWISEDGFLAGYGAAQALPGPLFTFSAYLGTAMTPTPNGWIGGLICLLAIFAPAVLLTIGALPFWTTLRQYRPARAALLGVNATVVGLLMAALYNPVFTSTVETPGDVAFVLAAYALLSFYRWSPWLVVVLGALAGAGLSAL